MGLTRRELLASAASATLVAAQSRPGPRSGNGPKVRTSPAVCLYSQLLIKVPYDELGEVLKGMGVDGCDLSVQRGGHVPPENAGLDLMRAVEAITGVGLDVPVITTAYTSLADPTIRNVAAVAGEMGLPIMRTGRWKYNAGDLEARLLEVQRDISGLASLARAVNMSLAIQNTGGDYVGAAVWDLHMILRAMDPRAAGYAFDPGFATAAGGPDGCAMTLRLAAPRLKMVTVRDFFWAKNGTAWKMTPCPLGEGMVDWPGFFGTLARARFVGPVSIEMDYQPKDELTAMRHDIDFVRKQIAAAYGG